MELDFWDFEAKLSSWCVSTCRAAPSGHFAAEITTSARQASAGRLLESTIEYVKPAVPVPVSALHTWTHTDEGLTTLNHTKPTSLMLHNYDYFYYIIEFMCFRKTVLPREQKKFLMCLLVCKHSVTFTHFVTSERALIPVQSGKTTQID